MKTLLKAFLFLIVLVWCLGIFVDWFVQYNENLVFTIPFLKKSYSLVCHQETNKLISEGNFHTMVCARCTGIYLGALVSSLTLFFISLPGKLNIKYLLLSAIPMIMDIIFYTTGLYQYSKIIALATGFLSGSVGFLYFYYGLENLINELKIKPG